MFPRDEIFAQMIYTDVLQCRDSLTHTHAHTVNSCLAELITAVKHVVFVPQIYFSYFHTRTHQLQSRKSLTSPTKLLLLLFYD